MTERRAASVHILLVEDNEGDILLTREAFEERRIVSKLSVVKNGEDAIDFVMKQGKYADAESPDLILLDLNLPMKNGHEVLEEIKSHPIHRRIPIIMLTTSEAQRDINKAYERHVNSFVTKPLDMEEFLDAIIRIEDFWFELIKLPRE